MDVNKKEIDELAKEISDAVAPSDKKYEVDDILNDILGSDGSYKEDFSEMLSKYHGGDLSNILSDLPGAGMPHRDYAAEADAAIAASRAIDRSISKKVSADVRATYDRETESAIRPEFTPDGSVRYPSYGVGESEQRVVYDADWEVQAKEEAARLEKLRRGNMLRGDSGYARSFQFSGAENRYAPKKTSYSGLIDPLSDEFDPGTREIYSAEAEKENPPQAYKKEEKEPDEKKPFFVEGFSARKKGTDAAGGKTENDDGSEEKGLSKEQSERVNRSVVEAFSNGLEADNEFKDERWQSIVGKAQKRKEQLEIDARKKEARQRSQQNLNRQKQKIAHLEEDIGKSPITDMNIFSDYSDDKFDSIDGEPENTAEKASAYKPESAFEAPAFLEVDAERLTPEEMTRLHISVSGADEKIQKTTGEKFKFFIKTHFSKEGFKRFAVNNLPQKSDSSGEKIRKTVRAVSFVALVGALVYLLIYYHNYLERVNFLQESESNISELEKIPGYELDNAWAEMRAKYPDVDFPEGMNIKFANLYAISRDVVGWLKIDGTEISTVLLQTDNDSYYLYRDIYGSRSRYGNPYVKASCSMGKSGLSKNTVIYGHNTHDKLIFNKLENYMNVQGYLNAPIITLDTLYETTKWKIFAVMLTNADPADDNGKIFNYIYSSFSSEENFLNIMDQIKARSMIHTGVDVQAGDKTIMLYTCYRNIFSSGRLVIVARQLREGESEDINKSLVYYNSSAIFPQAYYDKKKGNAVPESSSSSAPSESLTSAPAPEPEETSSEEIISSGAEETSENVPEENEVPAVGGHTEAAESGGKTEAYESASADNGVADEPSSPDTDAAA
ncbi:MAG: class B sortase [Oscillospiraceae bacterium]|nr:class B sortase [Oscillospiraceae bacterium]